MNKDQMQGNWEQFKGQIKQQWGKLTDNDLDRIRGNEQEAEGILQERYGHTKEQAKKAWKDFKTSCGCSTGNKAA